jgi:hypothetical protein
VSAGIISFSADDVKRINSVHSSYGREDPMRRHMIVVMAFLFVFVGVQRFAHADEMKAKMEEMKGEANAKVENAKGEAKALSEEAQGNKVKGAMERTKGKTKAAGERIKGTAKQLKAKTE